MKHEAKTSFAEMGVFELAALIRDAGAPLQVRRLAFEAYLVLMEEPRGVFQKIPCTVN